ncbi:MAG: helix-turn-helix transcriptional regulator, partial [Clostridia bacterium]|nr:helix-turn-helix transcriptional regulator [Clostridia bacterium]
MEIISKRLKALRESVGLSQNKLAQISGMKQSSINRYENGSATPSPENMVKLADYYDVSLDYIYGRTDNPQG